MNIEIPQALVDNSPGLVFAKDISFRFTYANQNLVRMAGLNHVDELIGKIDEDMVWRKYANKYRKDDAQVLKGKHLETIEYNIDNKGVLIKVYTRKQPIIVNDEITGLMGFARVLSILTKKEIDDDALVKQLSRKIPIDVKTAREYFMGISPREAQCLFYFIRGYSYRAISDIMNISKRTVESYLNSTKNRFNVESKQELIETVMAHGFYDIIPDSIDEFNHELVE